MLRKPMLVTAVTMTLSAVFAAPSLIATAAETMTLAQYQQPQRQTDERPPSRPDQRTGDERQPRSSDEVVLVPPDKSGCRIVGRPVHTPYGLQYKGVRVCD